MFGHINKLVLWAGLATLVFTCGKTHPDHSGGSAAVKGSPLLSDSARAAGVVRVELRQTSGGYRLLRAGQPYYLRGAGGVQQLAQLRAAGGNTLRLWSTDYAGPLLDEAQAQGLTVMLGLWLQPEDEHFSYYDPAMVRAQLQRVRAEVLRYRHHPALLMWNVGNEVEYSANGPRLFEAVNEIAALIHALDPYHPVTMSLGDFDNRAAELQRVAPGVDILSLNIYGRLHRLPALLRKSGWRGPYIVTEFGSPGFWESDSTAWGAPQEQTSADKAAFVGERYRKFIRADSAHCLGSYVFYWGSKFEYTPTWFSLFGPAGEKTELVDEMSRLWQQRYPANRAPHLTALRLAGRLADDDVQLEPGRTYPADVQVTDPEGDSLVVRWEVLPEMKPAASIKEAATPPEPVSGCIVRAAGRRAVVRAPRLPGPYRLCVRVFDGHGSVGTANVPVLVRAPRKGAPAYSAATISD